MTAAATVLAIAGVAMIVLSFVGGRLLRGVGHGLAAAGGAGGVGAGAGVVAGPPLGGPPAAVPAAGWAGGSPSPIHRSPSDQFAASDSWNPQAPSPDPGVYDRFGQSGHARRQSVISVGPQTTPPADDGGWPPPVDPPA